VIAGRAGLIIAFVGPRGRVFADGRRYVALVVERRESGAPILCSKLAQMNSGCAGNVKTREWQAASPSRCRGLSRSSRISFIAFLAQRRHGGHHADVAVRLSRDRSSVPSTICQADLNSATPAGKNR